MTKLRTTIQWTKLAPVLVAIDPGDRLVTLRFLDTADARADAETVLAPVRSKGIEIVENARACAPIVAQVKRFVAGRARGLDVAVLAQGTPFQRSVWRAISKVPYGRTTTYRELAAKVGRPTAWRAVARANAANPTVLVVPCHRVIGSNGKATGYHGGVSVKEALIALEARSRA